jgi:hypothetical protein
MRASSIPCSAFEGALGGVLDALAGRGGARIAAVDDVARHAVGEGLRRGGMRLEAVAGRGQLAAGVLRGALGHAGAVVVDTLPQRAELHQELHALLRVDGAIRRQRLHHLDDAVDVALVLDAVPDDRFHRVVGIEVRVEDQVRAVTDIREGVDDALNELLGARRAILRAGAAGGLLPLVLQRRQALRRVEHDAVLRFGRVEELEAPFDLGRGAAVAGHAVEGQALEHRLQAAQVMVARALLLGEVDGEVLFLAQQDDEHQGGDDERQAQQAQLLPQFEVAKHD